MPPERIHPSLEELTRYWNERLEESGFHDIEEPDQSLKEWHSFKFISISSQVRQSKRSDYQRRIDDFANDPQFPEILKLMVKHWNSKFTELQVESIWSMHRGGLTERAIAVEMTCSKTCIHYLLRRLKEWMNLI